MTATKKREIDLSEFPPGTITEYTTLVCLACIFDIFTRQLGLAPRTAFSEVTVSGLGTVSRSSRLNEGWECDGARLFLAPNLYSEALLIQYLVSRSHAHGGLTLEGRLTLRDLVRHLRYSGYLDQIGITERESGEVFEKLINYLASTQDCSRVRAVSDRVRGVSTGSGSGGLGRRK